MKVRVSDCIVRDKIVNRVLLVGVSAFFSCSLVRLDEHFLL